LSIDKWLDFEPSEISKEMILQFFQDKNFLLNDNKLSKGASYSVKYKYKNIFERMVQLTKDIVTLDQSVPEMFYILYHNIDKPIYCKTCGTQLKFSGMSIGYGKYCNSKCANNDHEVRNKIKNTMIKKYGVDNPLKSDIIKEKVKNTIIEKYGVDNISQLEYVRKSISEKNKQNSDERVLKIKDTCLEKYGVDNVFKDKNIQEKYKNTIIEKYGVENLMQLDKYKQVISEKNKENSNQRLDNLKKSLKEKYGVENLSNIPGIKEKSKQTCLEKYGVEYFAQSDEFKENNAHLLDQFKTDEFKEKARKTMIEKYGVDNYTKTKEYREYISKINRSNKVERVTKMKETCLEKYGVESNILTAEFKEKSKQTCLEKYGNEVPMRSEIVKDRFKKTMIEKYGVDSPLKYDQFKQKAIDTMVQRYGVKNIKQKHLVNYHELANKQFWLNNFINEKNNKIDIYKAEKYFNIKFYGTIRDWAKKLGLKDYLPNKSRSKYELEIIEYVQTFYNGEIVENTRSVIPPKELDIYFPEKKLAIEFDGLIFHSFGIDLYIDFLDNYNEENSYIHLSKTIECEKNDVQLLHIFENEWMDDTLKDIWKSVIKSKFGLNKKIYARHCEIKKIDDIKLVKDFLNENHLQQYVTSKVNIGLYYDNELVGIMTFGRPRFNKNFEWELLRYCSKKYINIIGGFSKLLKFFITMYKPKNIISYANRRWSNGKLYEVNNFDKIRFNEPSYHYFHITNPSILFSRVKFQKHKLKNLLEFFDDNLTETENMYLNGFRKIYDCGSITYSLFPNIY
jgi:hypothetical protein